jgi:phage terminase Nu1 subunit (DNA packaging protein)
VGINYMEPFDFAQADRLRQAMRHAARAPFSKMIYVDPAAPTTEEDREDPESKDPAFAEIQKRREHFRAELARLDFEERTGTLVLKDAVSAEWFRIARLVRDAMLNIPSRLAGILTAESDQRTVHNLLEAEIRQALEALADELGTAGIAAKVEEVQTSALGRGLNA